MTIHTSTSSLVPSALEALPNTVKINPANWTEQAERLLTPAAVELLVQLHNTLEPIRAELLEGRKEIQAKYDAGEVPTYLPQNSAASKGGWKVATLPKDLRRRRVEITGPVNNTKMVIGMLSRNNAGARADMAMLDFEDSMKPAWQNVLDGLENVIGAAEGTLAFTRPNGKTDKLDPDDMAGLMVRVRGLHMNEDRILIDGKPVSAGLFDFAMCMFYTAQTLVDQGKTPKFYVPKCEHYREARWWNRLFTLTERALELPSETMRATFLIETLTGAYQIEEILYEIRNHAAGLNVGRWDKIFSDIKVLKNHPDRVMADRATINLSRDWMKNYAIRLINTCHSRGAMAIGGMSAFTPGKSAELRAEQTAKVAEDKQFEASIGHDGCWVSHPYFIGTAMDAFTEKNQLEVLHTGFDRYPDLLPRSEGAKTMAGLRTNVRVGIAYLKGWNEDIGCVSWDNMMEDLATLEISRAQTWQWLHHKIVLDSGEEVTSALVKTIFSEEYHRIIEEVAEMMHGSPKDQLVTQLEKFAQARKDAERIFLMEEFASFLTTL